MTRWFVMVSVLAGAIMGCSSNGSSGGTCAASVPASCPTNAPSYKTDVAPILSANCTSCHAPGGQQSKKPLDTYAGVSSLKTDVEDQVSGCAMPPGGESAQPTTAQRDTILAWIACGAQNN